MHRICFTEKWFQQLGLLLVQCKLLVLKSLQVFASLARSSKRLPSGRPSHAPELVFSSSETVSLVGRERQTEILSVELLFGPHFRPFCGPFRGQVRVCSPAVMRALLRCNKWAEEAPLKCVKFGCTQVAFAEEMLFLQARDSRAFPAGLLGPFCVLFFCNKSSLWANLVGHLLQGFLLNLSLALVHNNLFGCSNVGFTFV